MTKISIVPFDNLVKIYCDSHHTNDMEAMKHLEIAFEHGMVEIIKELAFTEFLEYEDDINNHLHNPGEEKNVDTLLDHAISLCVCDEQKSSLLNIEEDFNRRSALEMEKYFINGFISGYKFLKRIKR